MWIWSIGTIAAIHYATVSLEIHSDYAACSELVYIIYFGGRHPAVDFTLTPFSV